jgi:hypothetical protein
VGQSILSGGAIKSVGRGCQQVCGHSGVYKGQTALLSRGSEETYDRYISVEAGTNSWSACDAYGGDSFKVGDRFRDIEIIERNEKKVF